MKYRPLLPTLSLLALLAAGPSAEAVTLFYGGDPIASDLLGDRNASGATDSRLFDNFTISAPQGWGITSLFGNGHALGAGSPVASQAYYEVRSGVSPGNGGSLLGSGTVTGTSTSTGGTNYTYEAFLPVPLVLPTGTYWFCVVPVRATPGSTVYQWETTGANGNGSPVNDGNAYWDSTSFGQNFVGQGGADYSMGIRGSVVPEPGSLLLGVMGAGVLALRRRRA